MHLLASAVHPIITQAKMLNRKLTASFILVLSKNALEVAESASELVIFGIFYLPKSKNENADNE